VPDDHAAALDQFGVDLRGAVGGPERAWSTVPIRSVSQAWQICRAAGGRAFRS
jgi:hypothetical protein